MEQRPTINDAKKLAYELRKSGVIIFAIGGGQCCSASYGMTRRQCDQLGKLLDRLCEMAESGEVDLSAFR